MKRLIVCLFCLLIWVVLAWSRVGIGAAEPGPSGRVPGSSASKTSSTAPSRFTPLRPLPAPKIIKAAEAYPGGAYEANNIVDGVAGVGRRSEYASASKGTGTFIDFDFGKTTRIAAIRSCSLRFCEGIEEDTLHG